MARQDRIAQLITLLEDAITTGNDDLAQEVRSDLFREYGLEMNRGGMASMDYMTRPVGYDNGGSVKEEHKTADIFGLHPLVVFQEMHDAYILDGGTLTFKEFFDAMQDQLNMEDLNEVPPVKEIG